MSSTFSTRHVNEIEEICLSTMKKKHIFQYKQSKHYYCTSSECKLLPPKHELDVIQFSHDFHTVHLLMIHSVRFLCCDVWGLRFRFIYSFFTTQYTCIIELQWCTGVVAKYWWLLFIFHAELQKGKNLLFQSRQIYLFVVRIRWVKLIARSIFFTSSLFYLSYHITVDIW